MSDHDDKYKSTWVTARYFSFRGSDYVGTPVISSIIARIDDHHDDGYIRLFDETNDNVIAEWGPISNESMQIYTTTPSNIPNEKAIFSVQGKCDSQWLYLYSLSLEF